MLGSFQVEAGLDNPRRMCQNWSLFGVAGHCCSLGSDVDFNGRMFCVSCRFIIVRRVGNNVSLKRRESGAKPCVVFLFNLVERVSFGRLRHLRSCLFIVDLRSRKDYLPTIDLKVAFWSNKVNISESPSQASAPTKSISDI